MMAASLHTLLSKLGLVLGISGFFHSTVTTTLATVKKGNSGAASASTASGPSIFSVVAPYFTSGILLGGLVLGLARSHIEAGLGVSILDTVNIADQASVHSIAALGALVGVGTKVSHPLSRALNLLAFTSSSGLVADHSVSS